ncbi:MAG: ABC transporter ATP-binding protein [Synergistaceae bacterium]|jgi:oligopeptide transport system ATP-binding protein|nr:ABC transporter ATP-binding protein [Synergistaceae bacterium]
MSEERLLDVKNLRTSFLISSGVVSAVRGIDIHVDRGEFLGVVGESGCGKSVSMLSVMRLLEDNALMKADSLTFDGTDLMSYSSKEMRRIQGNDIGMIFQDPMTSLNPLYTIGNQIMEPLRIHKKMSGAEARRRAAEMLDLVGISSPEQRLKQYPHEFSGGMRQRAMIAIAMCCNPKLLIADEPTTALDVTIQAQILELMKDMKEKFATATVLITHDLGVIASTCTRVVVMYGGLVMESGMAEDIFYRPGHPYTIGLLNSISGIDGAEKKKLVPIPGSPPDLMNPPAGCPFMARCDYAMRICASSHPVLTSLENGHSVACWLTHSFASGMRARLEAR